MKTKLRRHKHNLSHYKLGTCNPGELVPVGLVEVCPGDTFDHSASSLIRFLPMNAPIMHRVQARIHHFFIPFRIIWDGFEDFITRQSGAASLPSDTLANCLSATPDRLAHYLGLPNTGDAEMSTSLCSLLPFAAYNKVYNEWYRDQDLVSALVDDASLLDVTTDCDVRRVAWQKDYFTSARPDPQKGSDVTLPLGSTAPVIANETGGAPDGPTFTDASESITRTMQFTSGVTAVNFDSDPGLSGSVRWNTTGLVADLSGATAATVNLVRRAFELQRLAERLKQFGSRYPEYLASMGIKSSDARLQRPEYLGGGKWTMSLTEVLQTAEGSTTPVGELRGHGIGPGSIRPYRRFFEEHGYVMSLMSIRPQAVYATAFPRMFSHGLIDGANDFYTPELERIGQQEIYQRELYPSATDDDVVFGYNDRYAEFRHQPSQVTGSFRVGGSLDYWTWARGFSSAPALNQTFTDCNPATRVFAEETGENVLFGVNHRLIAYRMLTKNVVGRIM